MIKLISIFLVNIFSVFILYSQNSIVLTFEAEEIQGGSQVPLDSVYVKNLDKNCDTVIYGDNPSLMLYLINGMDMQPDITNFTGVHPNPFDIETNLKVNTARLENIQVILSDMQGNRLHRSTIDVTGDESILKINTSVRFSLLTVRGKKLNTSYTLINTSPGNLNSVSLVMTGSAIEKQSSVGDFLFEFGDELLMIGSAEGYIPDTIYDAPSENTVYNFYFVELPEPTIPEVITLNISQIFHTSVEGGGNVIHDGWSQVTSRGLCWSLESGSTIEDSSSVSGFGVGEFSSTMDNLDTNTTYYFRAYAINSIGIAYGEEMCFTSKSDIPCPGIPIITHGGENYETVLIGGQCWLKRNLNVGTMIDNDQVPEDNGIVEKWCYDDDPANCAFYGGLYRWDEAMQYDTLPASNGICPPGWHIPTDEEIIILESTVDSQYAPEDSQWNDTGFRGFDAGHNLKSSEGWFSNGNGSDVYGFFGLPAGHKWANGGDFTQKEEVFHLWSSSLLESVVVWVRDARFNHDEITRWDQPPLGGKSVRCVYDETFNID